MLTVYFVIAILVEIIITIAIAIIWYNLYQEGIYFNFCTIIMSFITISIIIIIIMTLMNFISIRNFMALL